MASFRTPPAWEGSWVITRGLRAGRLPLIESSQQTVFYEASPGSQPAGTCPDIIKGHTVSRRSLAHVCPTRFRTIPPFVTHFFRSRSLTTSGEKKTSITWANKHAVYINLVVGVPAGWGGFVTHPGLMQIPQTHTCNWWWIKGEKQFSSSLAYPKVFLSRICLMCVKSVPYTPFHLYWRHNKPARRNGGSPGPSQHTATSPHTSITNLSPLIGLQTLWKSLSPLPFFQALCFWLLLSSSPSLRVSCNAGRSAGRARLCVGGLSASFLFKREPTQRPHFPAKFKPEAMLTVWCYRPLSSHISIGKVVWTWVGISTPHNLLHHCALTATFRLTVFVRIQSGGAISHSLRFCTCSAHIYLYSALLFHFHFVWPLVHFRGPRVCLHSRALHCLLQPSLPLIGVEWESEKRERGRKEAPQPASLHQWWQLLLFHIARSHFYSRTSQPMSSHLPSPACKLYCSVPTNDAYQQWCVFGSRWHSKYKWGDNL